METWVVVLLVAMGAVIGILFGTLSERRRGTAEAASARETAAAAHAAALAAHVAERDRHREDLVRAQRDLDAANARMETWAASQRTETARLEELRNQFEALAQQVLRANSDELQKNAAATLEQRGKAIEEMLAPFKETLVKLELGTQALELKREGAYATLREQLEKLAQTTTLLQGSSTTLISALRGGTTARGRWGELQLQNIAELAGMTRHCDFETQVVLEGARPDMVVNLPGGEGRIPVDAKAPMDAYMRALEASDPAVRSKEFADHADALRKHVLALGKRDYATALGARVDFTVMFIPGDPILAAAFEADPGLQVEAMEKRVLIVTPVTLIALLRTVALYWRQQKLAENAQVLSDAAREFHKRVGVFVKHFAGLGGALDSAMDKYNKAVGSYERMVLPQARRIEELSDQQETLPEIPAIEEQVRALGAGRGADEAAQAAG
jgi:DNA recombination protein RmuC